MTIDNIMKNFFLNIGRALVRHKTFWTIFVFVIYAGFIDPHSLLQFYRLHSENDARRAEIASLEARYNHHELRLEELATSQDAIESVARVTLKMKTDDEDLYIVEDGESVDH